MTPPRAVTTSRRGGGLSSAVGLTVLIVLWVGLFVWRKTFAYVSVGGLYVIEFSVVAAYALLALQIVLRPDIWVVLPARGELRGIVVLSLAYVGYSVVRAIVRGEISAIALIPGIYPAYLAATSILTSNVSTAVASRAAKLPFTVFLVAPGVGLLNSLLTPYIGTIESPGWTYVYGVTLALSLLLVQRVWLSTLLFGVNLVFALLLFQRGTFVAFAVACGVVWAGEVWSRRRRMVTSLVYRGIAIGALALLLAPIAIESLTGGRQGRFTVSPVNLMKFLLSIFSGDINLDGGVSGTRAHRLEMWREIIGLVFSSIDTAMFGFGFAGEVGDVIGISFRAPHNGFVTILYRTGLLGLGLFLLMLWYAFRLLRRAIRVTSPGSPEYALAATGLVILGAMIGESLAGTMLDSPFTSMMFYVHLGIIAAILNRLLPPSLQPPIPPGMRPSRDEGQVS